MSSVLDAGGKSKNNAIVNGLDGEGIFDAHGSSLLKNGSRSRGTHNQHMREEGVIQKHDKVSGPAINPKSVNYSAPDSIHSRLNKLIIIFLDFQKSIINQPQPGLRQDLNYVSNALKKLCDENIYQVMGELFLSDARSYFYKKPLYIAASLNELVNRYNQYNPEQAITEAKRGNLLQAALLHNLGLLISQHKVYSNKKKLTPDQRAEICSNYPRASASMAENIGISEADILEAIQQHSVESRQTSLEAQLLRMPFVYADIAMRESVNQESIDIINPTREFARLFSENKLDPVLGGLFLKINGLAPVGSILLFDSHEKALIVEGPNESNIASSTLRMMTNNNGVQLSHPGARFRLDRTVLVQKGMSDHQQFAWNKFPPFAAWEL